MMKLKFLIFYHLDLVTLEKVVETGKRWKLFCLQLSFIGWAILAACTLGIGYFGLIPYIQLAVIAFYKFACGKNETNNDNVIDENSTNE